MVGRVALLVHRMQASESSSTRSTNKTENTARLTYIVIWVYFSCVPLRFSAMLDNEYLVLKARLSERYGDLVFNVKHWVGNTGIENPCPLRPWTYLVAVQ